MVHYQLPEVNEGSNNGGRAISNGFQPEIYSTDDQTVFKKRKRGLTSENEDNYSNDGSDDEQEVLYLPVYSDSDTEYLNRHKFSTLSKRSMDPEKIRNLKSNQKNSKKLMVGCYSIHI